MVADLYRLVVRPLRGRFRTVRFGSIIISAVFMVRPLLWAAFYRVDDPFTLWWLYRPLYGLVKLLTILGDPSTLWRLYRPLYGLVKLFTVLGDPSTLWALLIWSSSVHFADTFFYCYGDPSILWTLFCVRPSCGF